MKKKRQSVKKQRREEKELEAFKNFWSGKNDKDHIINSEENLDINIEDVVEQEVNKRRKQERDKEEMRLHNI